MSEDDSGVTKRSADELLTLRYSSAPDTDLGRAAGWDLVARHCDDLHKFARSFGLSEDDAYDVALQASEKALNKLREGRFEPRGPGTYRRWLFKLTRNMILDQLSIEGREEPLAPDDDDGSWQNGAWGLPSQPDRAVPGTPEWQKPSDTPENQVLQAEEHIRVELLLNDRKLDLKPKELEMLNHTQDGDRPRHIEQLTGIPSAQVSRLLYRAREKIKRSFPTPQDLLQELDEICTRTSCNCG